MSAPWPTLACLGAAPSAGPEQVGSEMFSFWVQSVDASDPVPLFLLQIEMAILRFPYESWGTPFQQLKQVVEEPSPQLPADRFSPEFVDFTAQWWVYSSDLARSQFLPFL